jgi:hypothetical protein
MTNFNNKILRNVDHPMDISFMFHEYGGSTSSVYTQNSELQDISAIGHTFLRTVFKSLCVY